jgi:hypothetical protein
MCNGQRQQDHTWGTHTHARTHNTSNKTHRGNMARKTRGIHLAMYAETRTHIQTHTHIPSQTTERNQEHRGEKHSIFKPTEKKAQARCLRKTAYFQKQPHSTYRESHNESIQTHAANSLHISRDPFLHAACTHAQHHYSHHTHNHHNLARGSPPA